MKAGKILLVCLGLVGLARGLMAVTATPTPKTVLGGAGSAMVRRRTDTSEKIDKVVITDLDGNVTDTPTVTNTPTRTATPTPTFTPTNTFTVTLTFTSSNTFTNTPTNTPTVTPTTTMASQTGELVPGSGNWTDVLTLPGSGTDIGCFSYSSNSLGVVSVMVKPASTATPVEVHGQFVNVTTNGKPGMEMNGWHVWMRTTGSGAAQDSIEYQFKWPVPPGWDCQ